MKAKVQKPVYVNGKKSVSTHRHCVAISNGYSIPSVIFLIFKIYFFSFSIHSTLMLCMRTGYSYWSNDWRRFDPLFHRWGGRKGNKDSDRLGQRDEEKCWERKPNQFPFKSEGGTREIDHAQLKSPLHFLYNNLLWYFLIYWRRPLKTTYRYRNDVL